MEQWDIYDKERMRTDHTAIRGEPLPDGAYHLVVHVCLFNDHGQMLIQQRQPFKEGWPDKWDLTVGGSALAGETSALAAMRELKEELGIHLDLLEARPHLTVNFSVGFDDIYLAHTNIQLDQLVLQEEEVQAAAWASCEEVIRLIEEGRFIPYRPSFIRLLFDMRAEYGCLQ